MATPPPTLLVERDLFRLGHRRIAALDEVGRGALAGPVSVGAVVIDASVAAPPVGLRDSKLLSPMMRKRLQAPIVSWVVSWAIGHASPQEIDRFGISAALTLASRRAIGALGEPVDAVLLDGTFDYVSQLVPGTESARRVIPGCPPVITRAKADRDCASVAAASVLAKVARDALMCALDRDFPRYRWAQNKGYGTRAHTEALARFGPCQAHRQSWNLPALR